MEVGVTIAAVSGPAEESLASFLDAVADPTPAPGGGTSTAVVAALGTALVEMAARLAGDVDAGARCDALRAQALELAEAELTSYAPVLEAMRLPGEDPARPARIAAALLEASATPLAIARAAAEAAELGVSVARNSSDEVRGDATAGVLLLESASAAAAGLVEINLAAQPSAGALAEARAARARAAAAREEAAALTASAEC
jgi:methenyltetrahydrofolate cyclohydrolase